MAITRVTTRLVVLSLFLPAHRERKTRRGTSMQQKCVFLNLLLDVRAGFSQVFFAGRGCPWQRGVAIPRGSISWLARAFGNNSQGSPVLGAPWGCLQLQKIPGRQEGTLKHQTFFFVSDQLREGSHCSGPPSAPLCPTWLRPLGKHRGTSCF